ncbi:MAG TPA: hypothetical protein PLO05_02620 [Bacteroidales bacterium]|nr:hypothetical protein [Bacteroidales bacterium]
MIKSQHTMKSIKRIVFITVISLISTQMWADKVPGIENATNKSTRASGGCEPSKTSTELAINNVRALIHTGGDMWWDLQGDPRYEVPDGGGRNALFAGSIWVGGKDANGQLKLAAQRFRQVGIDFWPGPLIISGSEQGTTNMDICRQYDRHYTITKEMVQEFREYFACSQDPECDISEDFETYVIPDIIMNWPAHGPEGGYDYYLAPFWDVDGDGTYNPLQGDFPYYEFTNEGITDDPDCLRPRDRMPKLFGDYTLWWVYNDRGNIHTETGGDAIGMEFRAQAFAFTTNDELNDMTFYNYNIINRSTYTLYDSYFGVWTDADLGGALDDFVGCDVQRGLGYCYNGDNFDDDADASLGYGEQPPAIGIDFFEGPYQDPDGLDNPTSYDTIDGIKVINCQKGDILNGNINGLNFEDGTVDNERWGMRRFLYFNNTTGGNENTTDPETAIEYYNYITGYWKDNQSLCYGGTGYPGGENGGDPSVPTDFMFPGNPTTDPCGWGQGGIPMPDWSEETEGNPADDRRFVQSAGPFVLRPGAINDITVGAVYARAPSGGAWASVEAVRKADDKAQILFENCFRVLNGPDAPELKIIEMDKKFIFHIYNNPRSNNYLESYIEKDPSIVCNSDLDPCDEYYRFQGYQIYQLKNKSATASDRYNDDLVRIVFQCDVEDGIKKVVNYNWSDELAANVPVLEVQGKDNGIVHTFVVEEDEFASGDNRLINHREYYYTALAYGYNNTMLYNQQVQETFNGQKKPYLAGRNNIKRYEAIPHINDPEDGGTVIQGDYGYGPEIKQIEGFGNSNNVLDLKKESIDEIMSGYPWKAQEPVYENGRGPINVKIIDPLNVPEDDYVLQFTNIETMSVQQAPGWVKQGDWFIYNTNGDTIWNESVISLAPYEQILPDWGLSVTIYQTKYAGNKNDNSYQNGFLTASLTYEDESSPWLYFLPDADGNDFFNWIRVGTFQDKSGELDGGADVSYDDHIGYDPDEYFEKVLGGTWAPYLLTSKFMYGTAEPTGSDFGRSSINKNFPVSSVDLVITSDKSKWTRACVIEMCENEWTVDDNGYPTPVNPKVNHRSEGNALRFNLRKSPSVDKEGNVVPGDSTHGLGWFPGYAIDVRSGERLNIMFGEDSWLVGENGRDMLWNPSSGISENSGPTLGGKHYIWIMGHTQNFQNTMMQAPAYDSCSWLYSKLLLAENGNSMAVRQVWASPMWTAIPLKNPDFEHLSSDITIKLRVATPLQKKLGEYALEEPINDNLPMYSFSTYDVKTIKDDLDQAESALDLINVVPNPYYGHSWYETNQLDNYVRITNLPRKCTISIYNVGGTLVRRFEKDSEQTFIDWDLKNSYNITVASGLYIMHFDVPGVGEKVVKWFGALRPIDLQNF